MKVTEVSVNNTYKASMFEMIFSNNIDSRLSFFEHQSTYSPNLPLRFLFYVADLYSAIVKDSNLYGTKLVEIPAPQFIIFYNGMDECPDR